MRLKDKVAVIVGAATGIGRATAILFAQEGATVIVGDINDPEGQATVQHIQAGGGTGVYVHCDVSHSSDVAQLMDTVIAHYGRVDVLHNNVGIDVKGKVHETTDEAWARCLDINLAGVFRGMKYAIPHMIRHGGGSIINTGSAQGLVGIAGYAAYAAAKGAVVQLTRQAAIDYAPYRIRVNCICPGTVRTPMVEADLRRVADPEARVEAWKVMHPLGRIGEPADIAYAALYLASDESAWVTGHVLVVDGGFTIKGV